MSCLSWNCRGLGNPQTEGELVDLVNKKDPKMIFLMETNVDKEVIERIFRRLQCSNSFVVLWISRGGLALLWKQGIRVTVMNSSERYIDTVIDHGMNDAWRFIGFYGDPDTTNCENSWSLLRDLSSQFSIPWVCLGDFNEIIRAEEKQGWLD